MIKKVRRTKYDQYATKGIKPSKIADYAEKAEDALEIAIKECERVSQALDDYDDTGGSRKLNVKIKQVRDVSNYMDNIHYQYKDMVE